MGVNKHVETFIIVLIMIFIEIYGIFASVCKLIEWFR